LKELFYLLFLLFVIPLAANGMIEHDGYIVKYKNNTKNKFAKPIFKKINSYDKLKIKSLNFNKDEIEYIEPNYIYHTLDNRDENIQSEIKWDMLKIQANKAWEIEEGNENVIVAVIDTGCSYTHEDLKDNIWTDENFNHGYDFANNDSDPNDDNGHGTHCSGTIGAMHNGIGIVGVNKKVSIMCLKFLDSNGSGSSINAIKSIEWAIDHGAKILSNSWGGGGFSQSLYDMIKYAKNKGVLFVAAAGNDGSETPMYPASYDLDNIISVAASDSNDQKASFSNYGLPHVDIAAPGVNINSTIPNNQYATYSGTSMACPHIAGAAALLLSYENNLSVNEIKDRILFTSDFIEDFEDNLVSSGRLNLYNMLMNIRPERPLPPPEDKWITEEILIETPHPYDNNNNYEYEININDFAQNVQFVRIHFSMFNTEQRYDKVTIKVGEKEKIYHGNLGNFYTTYFKVLEEF